MTMRIGKKIGHRRSLKSIRSSVSQQVEDVNQLNFASTREQNDYFKLKKTSKTGKIGSDDISSIIAHAIKHRTQFNAMISNGNFVYLYLFSFIKCCCCKRKALISNNYKNTQLQHNGMIRLRKELDIIQLLKAVRTSKLIYASTLT